MQSSEISPQFESGFSVRTVIGAVFVAFVMMPGTIYLGLIAGAGLGPAAQWVTIILFTEIARRSFTVLKRQEVYILYYMAAALAMTGGPFGALIWNQYLVQSPQAVGFGIADQFPKWAVPSRLSEAILGRDLFHPEWFVPVLLIACLWTIGRATTLTMGYTLFRVTADVEKLSFPMAPIAAEGATALAETTAKKETWRWNVFSVGAAIGLVFGSVYVGIPGLTGVLFTKPLKIIPIPFVDLTQAVQRILPAALAGISIDVGALIFGMVLPYPMVAGLFVAAMASAFLLNPILQHYGLLPHWNYGMALVPSKIVTDLDFWMSVGIGASLCVAFLGVYKILQTIVGRRNGKQGAQLAPPPGRGDIRLRWCVLVYIVASLLYVALCRGLLKQDSFPWLMMLVYAVVLTPVISYISARMIGLTGSPVAFPFLREGSIILSGYKGVDIWFAPLPLADHGVSAQMFRELTLTRTKFSSLVKIELVMLPLALLCSFLFWAFFWNIEAIPSATYPFTEKMWPLNATYQCLFMTATGGEQNWLQEAIKWPYVAGGMVAGFGLLGLTSLLGLPSLFFYGMIGGLGAIPNIAIPMFIGAVLGRRVFARRYGAETWRRYTPVLAAGYACGVGLAGMLSVAFAMVVKTVSSLPF
ncbi:MAG: peptide transporter [Candidatus Hydrogenedentes bacterium]|nr:peptide transporter [Candidatus Hydrogenedentota bacterium]